MQTITNLNLAVQPYLMHWWGPVATSLGMRKPWAIAALLAHGLLITAALIYTRYQYQTRKWNWIIEPSPTYMYPKRFATLLIAGHWLLLAGGIWITGIGWLFWAALAIASGHVLTSVLNLFNVFDNPAGEAGKIDKATAPIVSKRPRFRFIPKPLFAKGKDVGKSNDW